MSIRVTVIGTSSMGSDHARIVAEDNPGASLRVVCDLSEDSAWRVADEYSAQHLETDSLSNIHRNDVDAIIIASLDLTHVELTLDAFRF